MKQGLKNLLQVGLVVATAFILIACDEGKKNNGGGTVYPQCVPSQANNFQCNPTYPGQGGPYFQGVIYIGNKGAYRQLLGNTVGCNCDNIDNQMALSLNINSFVPTGASQGQATMTVLYDQAGWGGSFQPYSTLPAFYAPIMGTQNGTIVQNNHLVGGVLQFVFSVTDINAWSIAVTVNRLDAQGNLIATLGNGQLTRGY